MKSNIDRSSHRRCSVKEGVLKNFASFTRKQLCFPAKFAKFLGTSILKNICEQLLLHRGCGCSVDDVWKRTRTNASLNTKTLVAEERIDWGL